jgi:hypothetical protein
MELATPRRREVSNDRTPKINLKLFLVLLRR